MCGIGTEEGFDIRKHPSSPILKKTLPAGKSKGFCYAMAPILKPATIYHIHRLCLQGKDEISMYFVPGRHLDVFRQNTKKPKLMPISISTALTNIEIAACFEPPTLGFNELSRPAVYGRRRANGTVQNYQRKASPVQNMCHRRRTA